MLLRVIHPNIDSIANVTNVPLYDIEKMIVGEEPLVLIYVPDGRWAFVSETHMDAVFSGIISLLENE